MAESVITGPFSPSADRRFALDRAHRGDIEGAFGGVRSYDTGPRLTVGRRLGTLLAIMGPGVIVMASDNDAGTLSVYAQAGQNYGLTLLWPLVLLAPVLFVNQEMVVRLGAVTGAGHARLIFERFGHRWGAFALGDLLAVNLVTIITELIGVRLALGYFGVSSHVSVPLAAVALVAMTSTGRFRRWERVMYLLIVVNLLTIPLALMTHPQGSAIAHAFVPVLSGRVTANGVLFVIALVGTTVSASQLFFQQSNVVDKRITARWLSYERIDTLIGALMFTAVAASMLVACAFAFGGTPLHGAFTDAGGVASALEHRLGSPAGSLFAIALLNASILGAAVVTLSTSYAVGDVLGVKHSLHRRWCDAWVFHGSFAVSVAVAAAVVLVPGAPLGIMTTAVQALAGVLLPSASVFLLLLCNDPAVLGPWTNPRWLNALATLVVGVLLVLSGLLIATTLLPRIDLAMTAVAFSAALAIVLGSLTVSLMRHGSAKPRFQGTPWERETWTMPPLESLTRPVLTRGRRIGLIVLRVYLAFAAALLVTRIVELSIGSA